MRLRLRVAALCLIATMAALDVACAAYLGAHSEKRHAELIDPVQPQAVRVNASDSQRASLAYRIPSNRRHLVLD